MAGATARKPCRAKRSTTPRTKLLSPHTSWMTTTPARGVPSGSARYALRVKPSLAVKVIRSPILASRNAHMPPQSRFRPAAVDHEVVPLGLDQHGMVQRRIQRLRATFAQYIAQIHLVVLPQAQIELPRRRQPHPVAALRSEEHTSELQSLMRISYAVFCLKKKTN